MPDKNKPKINSRLDEIQEDLFDLLVIGGGITGASVLWDATLRGLKTILAEKNDYASGTSQATSKMIHGGLRYLKNAEFSLVRESLKERSVMGKLTPHSIRPLGYILPIYKIKNRILLSIGLTMYDLLGFDRNWKLGNDNQIPEHTFLSREATIAEDPNIPRNGLLGSFLYYDYSNINPERHTSEFIFSAKGRGGKAFNYCEVIFIEKSGEIFQVTLKDKLTSKTIRVNTKTIVNAAGPWADFVDGMLKVNDGKHLIRSKGIHIVTRKITGRHTYIIQTKAKKHMFIIPWRDLTLIGTTDTIYSDHPDKFRVTLEDITQLIEEVNQYSNFWISLEDVRYYYGGLRPLVEDSTASQMDTYKASRKTEIVNHKSSGVTGFFTALGGKYTTSRQLAESVVDMICDYLHGKWQTCSTKTTPPDSGNYADVPTLIRDIKKKFPKVSDEKVFHLAHRHGANAYKILKIKPILDTGEISLDFSSQEKYYPEEINYILLNEDVTNLSDLYFRRSGIGNAGKPSLLTQNKIQEIYKKFFSLKDLKGQSIEFLKRYEIW
jgi:glycerol-3-phosphate dehydrogenase